MLEDGSARCRKCGRVSVPQTPRHGAGIGRAMIWVFALFVAVFVIEALASWSYAGGSAAGFRSTFTVLAFVTGIAALVVGGIGAAPGRVALGTQRFDRLASRMYPMQDPVLVGTMSLGSEVVSREEPGAAGIFLLVGLGIALIGAAFVLTVA